MFNIPQFHNAAKLLLVGWIVYAVLKFVWDESGMRAAYLPSTFGLIILLLAIVYVVRNFSKIRTITRKRLKVETLMLEKQHAGTTY